MAMRSAFATLGLAAVQANGEAPVAKVLSMISDLQATIIKEGEVAQREYAEYSEWCEDRASNLGFEIKTGKGDAAKLNAAIAEETATMQAMDAKIDELTAAISVNEADLKAAGEIRNQEQTAFAAEESELVTMIDTVRRATSILSREMAKGGASMMQLKSSRDVVQAFSVMLQASLISTSDASRLTAFIQSSARDAEDDEPGAPASAVYESHSGDIVDTLENLLEKAEGQLSDLRNKETTNLNNFQLLKQSLEDELKFGNQDLVASRTTHSTSAEAKATAEGELGATMKELAADQTTKADLHHNCMTKAETFEAETKSRGEELTALATAKKVVSEATGVSFGQMSFVQQASRITSGTNLAQYEVVRIVRDLAHQQQSGALMQLASRLSVAMHASDPFTKIKSLIADMIGKLEAEASADATEKAYCDKELSETHAKKDDKTAEIQKITTRIDRMEARSAQLKEEIAALQNALSKLAASQANMDKLRQEEKATFDSTKAELDKGLTGIKLALKILNEYYAQDGKAHTAADGAGAGIISLLEVVEADFSKNLAQITADEDAAVAEYKQTTQDNEIEKAAKVQDVVYKTKESKRLDKTSAELIADRSGVQAELDAVNEYLAQLEKRCIAKAETWEHRKERYEAEIAGLKQALNVLETETALVQRHSSRHRTLRGALQL